MTKTAVELLQEQYDNCPESFLTDDDFDKAKEIQKQQMFAKALKFIQSTRVQISTSPVILQSKCKRFGLLRF